MACSALKHETDFVDKVTSDLASFVELSSDKSVLVFPPVNSFYRFLIHQLAQDSFDQLRTFSIGEDPDRRIVVCTKDLVARVDASKDEPQTSVRTVAASSDLTMVVSDTDRSNTAQVRKSKTSLPTIGIYRPPAARRSTEESSEIPPPDPGVDETVPKNEIKPARSRLRRPDQQVYVPRAKRAFKDSEKFDDAPVSPGDQPSSRLSAGQTGVPQSREKFKPGSALVIVDKKSSKPRPSSPSGVVLSLPPRASQLVETKKKLCQSTSSDLDLEGIRSSIPVESDRLSSTMNTPQPISLPPRAEVLVEKKKKLCQSSSLTEDYKWKAKTKEVVDQESDLSLDSATDSDQPDALSQMDSLYSRSNSKKATAISGNEVAPVIDLEVTNTSSVFEINDKCDIVQVGSGPCQEKCGKQVLLTETSIKLEPSKSVLADHERFGPMIQSVQETESSDDDYQDARNDSNRIINISDGSCSGSSESLSSSDSVNYVAPVQLMKPVKAEDNKTPSPVKPSRVFNPDECDWDALLDEDVLDPFLMKELTSAVGEVQVTQPKCDYRNYRSQVPADQQRTRRSAGEEDFSHVVEISSFPPEFKTSDLVAVFSPFKNTAGGFEIKWVDDTHALGVFASALVAEQVLAYQHPMVRTRPLSEATLECRLKARRLSESIHSFRPRPETCAALARRLVTGALGVKLPTARQEREEEKRVLREAREKRRLAVQQQDDVWNS